MTNRPPRWSKAVLANGRGAWAVIRKLQDTGVSQNHLYFVRLTLEVQLPSASC
jgi:hypothetical protein